MRRFIFMMLWLILGTETATAVTPADNPRMEMEIQTGAQTGTYHRFGEDIARVAAPSNILLTVRESSGSIDNLKRLQSVTGQAPSGSLSGLGIVQSDMLAYLRRSKNASIRQMTDRLRVMFPLYREEVHLLARKDIASVEDLQNKRLIVGPEGSGHWLTAMNLIAMLELKPVSVQRMTMEEAVLAVLRDRADAVIFVGGKPVKLFSNLAELNGHSNPAYRGLLEQVHFLPLHSAKLFQDYEKAEITPKDYPFVQDAVPTIAVRSVLVTLADSTPKASALRCNALGGIGLALRANRDYLRDYGHPKWKEVDFEQRQIGQWQLEPCVDQFQNTAAAVNDPLEKDLLQTIEKRW